MEPTAQPTATDMNNITITISRDHYDLILKAIDYYNEGIKQRLADQAQTALMKDSEKWTVSAVGNNLIAYANKTRAKSAEAPYGYKKDGTPKQRPGRKSA